MDTGDLALGLIAVIVPVFTAFMALQWKALRKYVKETANPYDDVVVGTIEDFAKMIADMAKEEEEEKKEMPINQL